jgi:hypothetical protein
LTAPEIRGAGDDDLDAGVFQFQVVLRREAVELDDHAAGAAGQELAVQRLESRRVFVGDVGTGSGVAVSARDQ